MTKTKTSLGETRLVMSVVIIAAFVAFVVFLVLNAGSTSNSEWERWIYIFGSVEAVAFTAVGWLFGREVNRQRATQAEHRADQAEHRARQSEDDTRVAERHGATLAGMVAIAAAGAQTAGTQPAVVKTRIAGQDEERVAPLHSDWQVAADFARAHYDL